MAFDGIVTKKIAAELSNCLINAKINKIFEPNKNDIILGLYNNGKNYSLNINISSNNYRLSLTTNSKSNPLNAPVFCMVLRKHLVGYKIKNIIVPSLERIIILELEGYNELNDLISKKLIVELMGKHSNIILVNNKNIIIDSLRHLDMSSNSYRDILPAHEYVFPISDKLDFSLCSFEDFKLSIQNNSSNLSVCIPNLYIGISKTIILNILSELNISDDLFSENDLRKIYDYLNYLIININSTNISCISFLDNDYTISKLETDDLLQVNFFLDDFYTNKESSELVSSYRNNLLKLILTYLKKISKKLYNINLKIKECNNMDTYKIYGELITSNLYKINNDINIDSIELENYYDNNNLIKIPLDKTISPSHNAKNFFKKYHKLKNTLQIVSIQKIEAEKELDYLESIIYELDNACSISELDEIYNEIHENLSTKDNIKNNSNVKKSKTNKRKVSNEYDPITYNVNGFTLYVGKNNKQNDYITTKLGKNNDIWFHTKDIRGSHLLLKCNGQDVSEHTIITCAQIAAFHSKAKLSSNVPVDYCFIKNVKKPSGSKPGMVIFKDNKTLYVDPVEYK